MTTFSDPSEAEQAAREAMKAQNLVWATGPEWIKVAFGGPPSSPPTIYVIEGRMQSILSGHTILMDAGDALWFWRDARDVALNWAAFANLSDEDQGMLKAIDDQGGSSKAPSNDGRQAYDRLAAAGLIKTVAARADCVAAEITPLGRRFLRWGT